MTLTHELPIPATGLAATGAGCYCAPPTRDQATPDPAVILLCTRRTGSVHLPPFFDASRSIDMTTVFAKAGEVRGDWYVVDAAGKTLGRLASELAIRLRGKHKPQYTPNVDVGDHIVVLNAGRVHVTGSKLDDKYYHHHTGFIGNLKSINLGKLLVEHPERAIEFAVKGMLPKTKLGRKMFRKLHVFAGNSHPHAAQSPKALEL